MGTCMKSFVFPEQWNLSLNVVASSEDAQITVAKATKGVERQLHLEFFESLEMAKDLKETNSLKNLVLEDCSDMVYVTVSTNNLKSFWYDGVLPRIVRLRDAMSLVHVVLDLRHGPGNDQFKFDEFLSNILISFKDVEVLTTSGWILEGGDVGTQYRSGIYFYTPEQEKEARESLEQHQKKVNRKIVTEILPAKKFYRAEEYHQQYLAKGGRFGFRQSTEKGCNDPIRCYG
ncbi:hypothetical protein C1H46_012650 [Malus baccata]|uniref:peptide-methionine (S)-S-oxide reductase n=1 Tax=Malus baccata TaxID=106549 RepID=A0A540MSC8_MALBA|nr:hypothetical protein C1H46_012650 [Malus baccata]